MPSVLTQAPLRTSRPFISPEHADPDTIAGAQGGEQPFGYAYAEPFTPVPCEASPQAGHYDRESQTWVGPGGEDITAGYPSYTRTCRPWGCEDRIVDDVCG